MRLVRLLLVTVVLLCGGIPAGAQTPAPGPIKALDITGTWKATFETQVGTMEYTYEFAAKDGVLTGRLESEMGGKGEIKLGKVEGDKVSFTEIFNYQGMELTIVYTGQVVSADEIKFSRAVAEFAVEDLIAKRVK